MSSFAQSVLFLSLMMTSLKMTSCAVSDVSATVTDEVKDLRETVAKLQKYVDITVNDLKAENEYLRDRMAALESRRDVRTRANDVTSMHPRRYNDNAETFSAYGCFLDTLTLACPDNHTILVTGGDYGQFSYSCQQCNISCTPRHSDDCTESMEESAPRDLEALKLLCDNQTSCEFINEGGALLSCPDPKQINHLTMYYRCLPEPISESSAVGFTASPMVERSYDADETVLFDDVLTNIGGAYDAASSVFTCPISGLYLFSMTLQVDNGDYAQAGIEKEGQLLVNAFAGEHADAATSSSNMAFVQCSAGERVSVTTHSRTGQMLYAFSYSTFSGMLVSH